MDRQQIRDVLRQRLRDVEGRIAAACGRAGRPRGEVRLVAVTKTVGADVAALLPELGVVDLGESRPQELWSKAAALPATVRWHLVGHLQRNKVERTLPVTHLIHSVDSLRLLQEIEKEAGRTGRIASVLLEVNASREANKHGFAPEEVPELASAVNALKYVRVEGLMGMAAFADDAETCRPTFTLLRELRGQLQERLSESQVLTHLSMGMTNDFEVAIEEGTTLVRVGTALFEGLP